MRWLRARGSLLFENEILLVVCTSTLLVMLGQGITAPTLPLFAKTFGVSTAAVGLTLSVFAGARMLVNLPAGIAADRWGRRFLLVGGPLLAGAGGLLSATATSLETLLVWRFVAGVGSALYMTGAAIVVTDIATDANRGRLLAINQGALLLGVTLGPAIGGVLAALAGLRAPFVLVGVAALAAAVWNYFRVPETVPRDIAPARPADAPAAARGSGWGAALTLLLSVNFALVSLVTLSVFFARAGRQTLLPLFARDEIGLGEAGIGGVFALMALLNLLLVIPAGALFDRYGARAAIVPSAVVNALAFWLIGASSGALAFVAATVVLGLGSGILGPAPAAYAAAIVPPDRRGVAMGLFRTVGDVGFVIAPPLVGFLADKAGFDWGFLVMGGMLLIPALLFGLRGGRSHTPGPRIAVEPVVAPPA